RDQERREPAGTAFEQNFELLGGGGQTADAGADDDADFVAVFPVGVESGIEQRLVPGENAELRITIRPPDFLWRRKRRQRIKMFHLAGDLRGERRRVERGDAVNAALAGDEFAPENIELMSQRGDDAQTGDDHAPVYPVACHKIKRGGSSRVQPSCPEATKVATIFDVLRCI